MEVSGDDGPGSRRIARVRLYAAWARPLLAIGVAVAALNGVGVALLLARAAAFERVALPPASLVLELLVVSGVPWLIHAAVQWSGRGEASVSSGALRLATSTRHIDVPLASIAAASAWRLPLPGPGVALRMASGRGFPWAVESDAPGRIIAAVGKGRDEPRASAAAAWASARCRAGPSFAELVFRWVGLPLAVAGVLFRAHQVITYGEPLGEWHVIGPAAALRTFAAYLVASVASLVVVAAAGRAVAEVVCGTWTAASPATAYTARSAAEWLSRFAVYVVPAALLAVRFLG